MSLLVTVDDGLGASSNRRSGRPRKCLPALLVAFLAAGLLAACGKTVTIPDVVGMRLDKAHQKMQDVGIENFDDEDITGKGRDAFRDHNWVVVEQSPEANAKDVDAGTKVKLRVEKVDAKGVLDLIPKGSPVANDLLADAKKEAAEKRKKAEEQAAEKAEKAKKSLSAGEEFLKEIDPTAKKFAKVVKLYDVNAGAVLHGNVSATAAGNALAARDFFGLVRDQSFALKAPPGSGLGDVPEAMANAAADYADACDALIRVIDTGAPSAVAEAQRLRDRGYKLWVSAMKLAYKSVDRKPVLPSP